MKANAAMPAIVTLLPAARDVDHPARRRARDRRRPDAGLRVLHLRDVRLRADLPDLPDGLRGGHGAARRGLDAADRRAALRAADDRGSRRTPSPLPSCAARSSSAVSPSATRARTARPRCATSSCACPPARTLGVVGTVGSGKSTLACVIPRLFEVDGRPALRRRHRHQPRSRCARCARASRWSRRTRSCSR